jgi:transposase
MVGRRQAADSRGEFFGSAAGIGDGASAWDFQPAAVRLAQGGDIAGFVPAVIGPEQPEKVIGLGCRRIEIVSVNGRRVIVDCDVDVESLLRIMRGLGTLP